jgi:hypothetical protein
MEAEGPCEPDYSCRVVQAVVAGVELPSTLKTFLRPTVVKLGRDQESGEAEMRAGSLDPTKALPPIRFTQDSKYKIVKCLYVNVSLGS